MSWIFVVMLQASTSLLMNELYDSYKIIAVIRYHSGQLFVRLSVSIYMDLVDYDRLRDAILDLQAGQSSCVGKSQARSQH